MITKRISYDWYFAGLLAALLLLLIMVLYQDTLFYLTGLWRPLESGQYAHGYLVLAVSAYLILRKRKILSKHNPYPDFWALFAVLLFSLLWMTGAIAHVEIVKAVALLLLVMATLWAVFGRKIGGELLFPVLFIIFAIPVWHLLTTALQDLTANAVYIVVRILNIPAFLQENRIIVPAGVLSVEETCGGMRYFLAALTLGALYGYLNYQSFSARLVIIFIAALSGVLANILRVFIVVYLGYATEMQHPLIHDHIMLGWYLFGALVIMLLFIDFKLYQRQLAKAPVDNGVNKKNGVVSAPVSNKKSSFFLILIAGAILLSVGPLMVYRINHQLKANNIAVDIILPVAASGWSGPIESDDDWMPIYKGAIVKKQAYSKEGQEIFLYIGYYPVQTKGKELIAYANQISNTDIWQTNYTRARNSAVDGKQVLEQLVQNRSGRQRRIWYWYNVGGIVTTNKYEVKVLQVLGSLTGEKYSYVIAVSADETNDAKKIMREFILEMETPLAKLADNVQIPVK